MRPEVTSVISPSTLTDNINKVAPTFRKGRQQDAHEFLRQLSNTMEVCHSTNRAKRDPGQPCPSSLFQGTLRYRTRCSQCNSCSDNAEVMEDLSLGIQKDDITETLEDALGRHFAKENLEGENQYECEKCKTKVDATRQIQLHSLPEVLTVHLKRFSFCSKTKKICKHVSFDETLDITELAWVDGPAQGHKSREALRLYAVLVHTGTTLFNGHYFCFIRTRTGSWYRMDDSKVVGVDWQAVQSENAYMLFYYNEGGPRISNGTSRDGVGYDGWHGHR